MSVRLKPSTLDGRLQESFAAPAAELYARATGPDASAALIRAVELRSFLALAEEQILRVRDRVHDAMAAGRDMDDLSADALRMDAQWLQAALDARDGYRGALDGLLRTMPPPGRQPRPAPTAQPAVTAPLPPAAPAPQRAGAARARRP
ncbi:hypothetical protein A6A06_01420 [Streptomyces sp. CB02923]|uniref:hypothetical protein n=1 Tax=Streptomyces sp. CB02923 TaxID=1718985 RepID=UPI0009397D60|nr:hypothetical protein [Streptomyces sp. CB02923]OKI09397.1 hypothetical protein A6A06_01420 [Streptomyces sp. CB02923]